MPKLTDAVLPAMWYAYPKQEKEPFVAGPSEQEELIDRVDAVSGMIRGVSEQRNWIELLYEGDLMHTKTVNFPEGAALEILVEEIPRKTTVYEFLTNADLF